MTGVQTCSSDLLASLFQCAQHLSAGKFLHRYLQLLLLLPRPTEEGLVHDSNRPHPVIHDIFDTIMTCQGTSATLTDPVS